MWLVRQGHSFDMGNRPHSENRIITKIVWRFKTGSEDYRGAMSGDRRHFKDCSDCDELGRRGGDTGGSFGQPVATESVAIAFDHRDQTLNGVCKRGDVFVPCIRVDGQNKGHGNDATE